MNRPEKKLVSIALATYNGEKYIRQQLESLVAQSYRPIEIVICDDCSTDGTLSIMEDFEKNYSGLFRVYKNKENKGFIKNFEQTMSLCRGTYIAPCDQDDVWHSDKLEKLVRKIGSHSLIHSDARLINERDEVLHPSFTKFAHKCVKQTSFLSFIKDNTVTGCTCMIRSDLLKVALPFREKMPHDHWLALFAADANGIAYTNERLIDYRQHARNTSGSVSNINPQKIRLKSLKSFLENRQQRYGEILTTYRELYAFISGRMTNRSARQFRAWIQYHESFFTKRIRFRAFFFHCAHVNVFARRKSLFKVVFDLFLSLYGQGNNRNE